MKKYASGLDDFPDLLQAAAKSKDTKAAVVEKDYYVTRALRALVEGHAGQFVLKGGTSLSKGWQLLRRFSEDIDLLVRDGTNSGKAARHTRLKKLAATIESTEGFKSPKVDNNSRGSHRDVSFSYSSVATDVPGLGKTVLLEAGYRGNASEATARRIRSIVCEFAETHGHTDLAADLRPFEIEVQSLRRTFVEKLFAAHAFYTKNFAADGKARHYYDLSELCKLQEIQAFAGTEDYRKCVAEVRDFSRNAFPSQALPASDSFATSLCFNPDADGLKELERNYKAETDFFFGAQPSLTDVLKTIGALLPNL